MGNCCYACITWVRQLALYSYINLAAKAVAVAELLTRGQYAAPTIMMINSCFTQAVFGQHTEKHNERRIHHMGTLHVDNTRLNGNADLAVLRAYKCSKDALFSIFVNSTKSLKAAKELVGTLINHFLKNIQTKIGKEALSWWAQPIVLFFEWHNPSWIGVLWLIWWSSTHYLLLN